MVKKLIGFAAQAIRALDFASPLADLAIRLYVANVFWKSGLAKIASWASTLYLFNEEYHVPLLPPDVAAWLATSVELGGSVLLALGLASRFGATALFILNFVAVISYPELSEAGRTNHLYWGMFLLLFILRGPGKLSIDHWIREKLMAGQ